MPSTGNFSLNPSLFDTQQRLPHLARRLLFRRRSFNVWEADQAVGYLRACGDEGSRVAHGRLLFIFLPVNLITAALVMAVTDGMWAQSWNPPITPSFYSLSQTLFCSVFSCISADLCLTFTSFFDCFSPSKVLKKTFKCPLKPDVQYFKGL